MSALPPGGASFDLASPRPTVVGRFEVGRHLGTGGMGAVYEALDREKNVRVALKTLKTFDPSCLVYLKNEFRALQDLRHPNLVTLFELIEDAGRWFVAMELVDGVPLLDYVRPGWLEGPPSGASETRPLVSRDPSRRTNKPTRETEAVSSEGDAFGAPPDMRLDHLRNALEQLAHGLCALHDAGKVHRDVKPANILVEPQGRLVLVDFGLAVDLDEGRGWESDRAGTRAYMAPEQTAGKRITPAADWYGVGCVVYQALTGTLPFRGGEASRRKLAGKPKPVRACNPAAPEDLAELCERLLDVDPAMRPTGREVLHRLGARESREPTPRVAFVGRRHEIAALDRALEDSRHGPVIVVVRGESGVGKSALVRAFATGSEIREAGALILSGRCYERELVPYKAFDGIVDALGDYIERLGPDRRADHVPPAAATLARMFPSLERIEGFRVRGERAAIDPQEEQARAFGALRDLLATIADERPLVLTIDDMQWADADSHRLLDDLLRPPRPPAICVVMTARLGMPNGSDALDDLGLRFDDVRHVDLGALPFEDASRLARAALGPANDDRLVEAVARETGGHPLFLLTLAGRPPRFGDIRVGEFKLDDALLARVDATAPDAKRVLELVAVAGTPLSAVTLAAAARLDRAPYDAIARELRAERLIRTTVSLGVELAEVYHDRVRETVLSRIDPAALQACHARLAQALAFTSQSAHDAASLVRHLEGAGQIARAAEQAETAARRAEDALAFDLAAEMIRTAMRLGSHAPGALQSLRQRLAEMLGSAGRAAEAAQAYLDAVADAAPEERLEFRRRAADHFLRSGHIDQGLAILSDVLREFGDRFPSQPAALVATTFGRLRARLRGLRWSPEPRIEPSTLRRIDAYHAIGVSLALIDPVRGGTFELRALGLALRAGDPKRLAPVLAMEAGYCASAGARGIPRARALLREVTRIAAHSGDAYQGCLTPMIEGFVDYHAGNFRMAATTLRETERRFRDQPGTNFERTFCHCFRLISLRYCGRYGELERGFFDWVRRAEQRGDLFTEASIRFNLNGVWLARNQPDEARRDLARTRWTPPEGGYHMQHWYEHQARFEIDLYEGAARRALASFRPIAARLGRSLVTRVRIHRVLIMWLFGRLLLAAAAEGDGTGELEEAARIWPRLAREEVPFARTYALLLRAGVAHGRGNADECVQALERAAKFADEHDYPHCASAARLRLGSILGGAEGASLAAQARSWMADQSIVDPERMAGVWAPGFARCGSLPA